MVRRAGRWAGLLLAGSLLWAPASWAESLPAQTPVAPLSFAEQLLQWLADPNVAYLLLVFGLLGLVAEAVTPGFGFAGVTGVIALLASFYRLLNLPTNWIGVALIVAGVVMLVVDLKMTGWALSIGGVLAFGLGSLLIFTPFWIVPGPTAAQLNPWLILGTTSGVAVFFLLGLSAAVRAHLRPVAMGQQTIVGQVGTVRQALRPTGIVHVQGEEWSAVSAGGGEIPVGAAVEVVRVEGLTLVVQSVPTESERS